MRGIVKGLDNPNITWENVVLVNSLYEMSAWCTSILAQMPNGTVIHQRNLDYDYAPYMRNLTFQVQMTRGGNKIWKGVMFAGNVGVYTGESI